MSSRPEVALRFGPFQLDPRRRVLMRGDAPLPITPKAFDLLLFLVERRGTVVEKEAILQGLWPNTSVEEGNITVTISVLRRLLGESKSEHPFIVTIPGRGYQFIAEVEADSADGIGRGLEASAPPASLEPRVWRPVARTLEWVLAVAAAAAVTTTVALYVSTSSHGASGTETADVEARSFYIQGQFFLEKRTAEGFYRALDYFEKAISRSPGFAAAHAGIADAHNMLGYFGFVPATDAFPRAEAAAREALRLDPRLPAAHTALAYIRHRYDWDWRRAEDGFRRAIALDPEYSSARHWYAAFLESMGRDDEAIAEGRRAQTLDPLALVIGANLGAMLGAASRLQEAVEQSGRLLEMDRTFWPAHWSLAHAYASQGRYAEADREFAEAAKLSGRTPYVLAYLAEYYAESGRTAEATRILSELDAADERGFVPAYYRAMVQAALGDKDSAFESLERAYEERSSSLAFLKIKRRLVPLRGDPRFQQLIRRVGLPN